MSDGIYLLQDNGELIQPNSSEDLLQTLIAKYPNLLIGDHLNKENPRRWISISREIPIASQAESLGRWSVITCSWIKKVSPQWLKLKGVRTQKLEEES